MPGNNPSLVKESLWHIPHACTLMRTCVAAGSGMSRSTISNGPLGLETCTECSSFHPSSLFRIFGIDAACMKVITSGIAAVWNK